MKSTIKTCIALLLTLSIFVSTVSLAQVQLQGPTNSPDAYSGVVYGPIDQNDTLWRIASRYKQGSQFSVYQTMLAIYELNPQAFENQNFNTMVNGATLQLPSDRYIARMDLRRARAKAEADDRAFGRPNSVQPDSVINQLATAEAEPEVPLVNQEDLSATKQELQRQLNSLNRQQNTQFNEVKEQVGASIESVQALLEENRRLYDRLDQVNQDIDELRNKVEGEVQGQIDQQLALQKEVIDLVKQAEQRQIDREANSIWKTLSSPLLIGIISIVLTTGILVILAIWLLRKPKSQSEPEQVVPSNEIVDDELVIGEMDEDDAEDLMAALDQEMGDDDILSSDLEDGLDELGVGETDFDEVDEMLVPDADGESKKTESRAQIVEEDISFDTDAISLDDDEYENQEIDLKPPTDAEPANDADAALDGSSENNGDNGENEVDEYVLQDNEEQNDTTAPVKSEAEVPENNTASSEDDEIDPDALLASVQNEASPSSADEADDLAPSSMQGDTALGVDIDESIAINDDSLEQIGNSINETTQEFENLSSEILNDLEGVVDEEEELDNVIDEAELETFEAGNAIEVAADDDSDAGAEQASTDLTQGSESDIENIAETVSTDLASETQELITEKIQEEQSLIEDDDSQIASSEELDELLEQFTQDSDESVSLEEEAIDLDLGDEPNDLNTDLADEILAELEQDAEVSDDDLDALLDEYTNDVETGLDEELEAILPSDASDPKLDDIPSLADLADDDSAEATEKSIDSNMRAEHQSLQSTEANSEHQETQTSQDDVDSDSGAVGSETLADLEEDVLADLPGLDDWLSDDELAQDIQNIDSNDVADDELNVLADIEGSDFEELLSEIDADSLDISDDLKALENTPDEDISDNLIRKAGLDLDSLMKDDEQAEQSIEDFVNVDDLLSQSDALTPLEDADVELDLEKSLGRLSTENNLDKAASLSISDEDLLSEQASNLDLAQVYMDMDDLEAAAEVLEEVVAKGSAEQITEAKELLEQIKKA